MIYLCLLIKPQKLTESEARETNGIDQATIFYQPETIVSVENESDDTIDDVNISLHEANVKLLSPQKTKPKVT